MQICLQRLVPFNIFFQIFANFKYIVSHFEGRKRVFLEQPCYYNLPKYKKKIITGRKSVMLKY